MKDSSTGGIVAVTTIIVILILLFSLILGGCYAFPTYKVWEREKAGEAELAQATANRKISIQEAQAKMESAKHLADAEVIRAEGVAKANAIIGESLKNNEGYLRYLYITSLAEKQGEVIYVPTEAGLPILEAGKRVQHGGTE